MALKRKLDKEGFEGLNEALKAEYTAQADGSYLLDADDAVELRGALEKEKREAKKLRDEKIAHDARTAELQAALDLATSEGGNTKAVREKLADMERSYAEKLAKVQSDAVAENAALKSGIINSAIDAEAIRIAGKISTAPTVLLPHVRSRLTAEIEDGKAIVRVLGPDGKASASTLEDLGKEFVANKDFAGIIVGSRASGSAGSKPTGSARASFGNTPPDETKPLANLAPKDLILAVKARREARQHTEE